MPDTLSTIERSERMGRVRGKETYPDMLVRRIVHGLGYRYALHARDLPGSPDLVFRSRRKVIFVHGCFWHRHASKSCRLARLPKSRLSFWRTKLNANRLRDIRNRKSLRKLGWKILIVWECKLGDKEHLENRLLAFLGGKNEGN